MSNKIVNRTRALGGAALAGVFVASAVFGITFSKQVVVIGALTGLVYAVLAAGLVLVYRATNVINFAHGDIGALGAAVLGKLVLDYDWNYVLALVVVVAGGAAVGAGIELGVVRRLFSRPRLVLLVATIGVSVVLFLVRAITVKIDNADSYPAPIDKLLSVGGVQIFGDGLLAIAVMPAIVIGLGVFLNRTPYGIAIRSSAENPDAARLAGISVKRTSTLVWAIAGAVAVLSVVAAAPLTNFNPGVAIPTFGPTLLLRALAAALVGRLVSLPLALVGGIGVGVVEAVLLANFDIGEAQLGLALAVVVLVLAQGSAATGGDGASFSLSAKVRPVPARLLAVPWVRNMPTIVRTVSIALGVLLPFVFTAPSDQQTFARMLLFAIIGLSVTVLTGWAGQLSLGQFGFVGCGAAFTTALATRGVPFGPAVVYATVATVAIALVVGVPALRIQGLFLAVTTIAFAVAADAYLIPKILGASGGVGPTMRRPTLGPIDFADQRSYYYLCLVVLTGAIFAVGHLRTSGVGRSLIAVRENPKSAAAFTVDPARSKFIAYAVSGALAAVAGGLLAGLSVQVRSDAFGPEQSLAVVSMSIIGGLGSIPGAVLGAIWVVGLSAVFGADAQVRAFTTAPALLLILLYLPGGFMQIVHRIRDSLLALAERRVPTEAAVVHTTSVQDRVERSLVPRNQVSAAPGTNALECRNIVVAFGGLKAVNGVDLTVRPDEIVGLIGTNGAGKSTLMNAISGFVPSSGSVVVWGTDVSSMSPSARPHAGIGRAFQDARLFGDLTVRESIMVAHEAREQSELVPSMLALPPARRSERRKAVEADDLIGLLGLGRYAGSYISELSTGTRRIVELACLLAVDTRLLLLDEPTAGVAQAETEMFGPLIKNIQRQLSASVLIIEHDMPLIMSMSDRVYCMTAGAVIAEGAPADVQSDPRVIASYLGTDERAIERSNQAVKPSPDSGATRRRAPLQAAGRGARP